MATQQEVPPVRAIFGGDVDSGALTTTNRL